MTGFHGGAVHGRTAGPRPVWAPRPTSRTPKHRSQLVCLLLLEPNAPSEKGPKGNLTPGPQTQVHRLFTPAHRSTDSGLSPTLTLPIATAGLTDHQLCGVSSPQRKHPLALRDRALGPHAVRPGCGQTALTSSLSPTCEESIARCTDPVLRGRT